jgi:hypothetical protein
MCEDDGAEAAGFLPNATCADVVVVAADVVGESRRGLGAKDSLLLAGFTVEVLDAEVGVREPRPVAPARSETGREGVVDDAGGTTEARRVGGGAILCLAARGAGFFEGDCDLLVPAGQE